jgi:D-sedoheptulose 7-phosphate isomerase
MLEKIKKARFIFICGNGGSASTAEHFTTDLIKKGYPAICLNSNNSVMTMIANDYGYQYVFSRQLETYANKKDLLIVFSVSGTSPNIVKALKVGIPSIEVFGFEGESYQDAEDRHLRMAHRISQKL